MKKRLWLTLMLLLVLCALVVGIIFFFSTEESRSMILLEISKTFLQLLGIGVLGALAKWSFDEYSLSRQRSAAINEFRKEILRRLVSVTNQVRKTFVLIEAARSTRSYDQQMRLIIAARQELSLIRHEIDTVKETFLKWSAIENSIKAMESYLDDLIKEYSDNYFKLSAIQKSNPVAVWPAMQELKYFGDLFKPIKESKYQILYIKNYQSVLILIREEIWSAAGVTVNLG
jgi:hypothetical protein